MGSEILNEDHVPKYHGFDDGVDERIHELARQITNASVKSNSRDKPDDDAISVVSSIAPGVNTINNPDIDPRLDPNSEEFSSRYWVKNLKSLEDKDPEYFKPFSLGISYKNLRAYGNAADADYQTTIVNAPLKFSAQLIRYLFTTKSAKKKQQFDILKSMDALINPGEVVVVLGRPGSGCSTLLKTISANTHGFHVGPESEIDYSGLNVSDIKKHFRGEVVYNAEADVHFPHLTVWQTLSLAAKFRTPQNRIQGVSREDYANHLTEVMMATYGLSHTKNTKVGGDSVRGVSGGERKRVSICEVSLAGAKLQCWDNATRGLDAATALEFIKALKTSADLLDTTSLVAIYQCSQDAYDLFNKVSVLYEGYQIYFGRTDEAKEYFLKMGWFSPPRQTTADFLTAVTSPNERQPQPGFEKKVPRTPKEFEAYWKASPEYAQLIKDIDEANARNQGENSKPYIHEAHNASQSKRMRKASPYTVSYFMQVRYLIQRDFQRIRNDWQFNLFQPLANSFMALILSSIFYNLQNTSGSFYSRGAAMFFALLFNAFSSFLEILTLFEARPIIEKHKMFALYHPSAAGLSSVISQLPPKMFTSIAFNLVFYFMVNFRRNPGRFFFYYLTNITATFAMSHLFRLVGAASPSFEVAMIPGSVMLLGLAIFVGFTIPTTYMLGWSRWINYINPLGYAFEALMTNEFSGRTFECSSFIPANPADVQMDNNTFICDAVSAVAGSTTIDGSTFVGVSYDYHDKHKWRGWGITLVFAIAFLWIYLVFTEYNESAKQKGEVLLFQRSTLRKIRKQQKQSSNDLEAGSEKEATEQQDGAVQDVGALQAGSDIFHWKNVEYSVKIKTETRFILNGVDGWVKPGTLTALMGSSGAGKTTLLDVLANRVTMGVVTGDMFVNGRLRDSSFQRSTGYVQQQDLHLKTSTVREALLFSARLRQPADVSDEDKKEYVEEVIKILEMEKYADAVVGVPGSGLNVEQRKRLTIGVELAAKPKLLLFLDEPTSGLDSQTAWSICQLMRKLANHGQAILCTIHQPSALLMQEFDRLLFLAKGGKTVYFGDLGKNCQVLIDYFEKYGAPKCPPEANPAEWMLAVIGAAPGSHSNQDYHEVWLNSSERQDVLKELEYMEKELIKIPFDDSLGKTEFAASYWVQYKLVVQRVFQQYWRTPSYLWAKMFTAFASALFVGFSFFKAKKSQQGLQNQMFSVFMFTTTFNPLIQQMLPSFVEQRALYETRERPSKTFSWIPFMLSQSSVEIPWAVFVASFTFLCYYYPVGFYENAVPNGLTEVHDRGAYGWLMTVLFFMFISTFGHLCIAAMELADAAADISMLCFTLCLTFCGVLAGPKVLPGFWIFMYRVSPLTYFVDGFLSNAVGHNVVECSDSEFVTLDPEAGKTCGEYLASYIATAGTGYLKDPDATSNCQFCSVSKTDDFLASVSCSYSRRWSNVGYFCAFIVFNIFGAMALYWLARVPKKRNRVKDEKKPVTPSAKSNTDDSSNSDNIVEKESSVV